MSNFFWCFTVATGIPSFTVIASIIMKRIVFRKLKDCGVITSAETSNYRKWGGRKATGYLDIVFRANTSKGDTVEVTIFAHSSSAREKPLGNDPAGIFGGKVGSVIYLPENPLICLYSGDGETSIGRGGVSLLFGVYACLMFALPWILWLTTLPPHLTFACDPSRHVGMVALSALILGCVGTWVYYVITRKVNLGGGPTCCNICGGGDRRYEGLRWPKVEKVNPNGPAPTVLGGEAGAASTAADAAASRLEVAPPQDSGGNTMSSLVDCQEPGLAPVPPGNEEAPPGNEEGIEIATEPSTKSLR